MVENADSINLSLASYAKLEELIAIGSNAAPFAEREIARRKAIYRCIVPVEAKATRMGTYSTLGSFMLGITELDRL